MAFPENTVNDTGIKHIWDKVTAALSGKVDKVSGKGLSTNDYTTTEKDKLAGIESGAQVNAVTSVAGKTGAVTLDKADVGLGNVDNTSDASKPISTATQNALDTKADTSEVAGTQTATGNPITLTDGSETYAQGLSVELEPKQDLHGYDFPWVGGAGKNLADIADTTVTSQTSIGSVSLKAGTYTASAYVKNNTSIVGAFSVYEGTSIHISSVQIDANMDERLYTSFTLSEDKTINIRISGSTAGYNYDISKVQVESGNQATPYAPYSNICPITGYTEVGVEDVGKNLVDISQAETITTPQNTQRNGLYINVKGNGQNYVLSRSGGNAAYISYINSNGNWQQAGVSGQTNSFSFQSYGNQICINAVEGGLLSNTYSLQLEEGQTATLYEPYQSRTASVTFGQTVYGGRSNFTDGGTDDEWENVDLGDLSWAYSSQYERFEAQVSNVNKTMYTTDDMLCSCFKPDYSPISASGIDGTVAIYSDGTLLVICKEYTDASTFKTAMTGQTVCYKKATPTTISTQPTDLKLLQDTNNLTTNGTTITLDYIPNNSIGDAVKASEEYTDRAVERVAVVPKATLIDTWMISEEADTISVDLSSYDCNFFLLEYLFQSKRGTTLIPRPSGGSFSASVVTYNNGTALYIELDYNPTTKELAYTSNVTSQFGILAIYTI